MQIYTIKNAYVHVLKIFYVILHKRIVLNLKMKESMKKIISSVRNAKTAIFAVMAVLAAASCSESNNKLTINSQMENMGDTLLVYVGQDDETPDTILVSDGKFSYTLDSVKVGSIFIIRPETAAVSFTAMPGETVELTGDMTGEYNISGSKFYQDYNKLEAVLDSANKDNVVDEVMKFAKANPENEAIATMVSLIGYMAPDSLDTFLGLISDKVKNGRMKEYLDGQVEEMQRQKKAEAEAKEKQAEGREVPDFTLNDIKGNPLALSSLRGKYVILDFWGSWCGWCIKGFPQMKEYYQKYKGKFEILGIDCSDSDEDWRKAVAEHELPWLHVYNPNGSDLLEQYGIQGFPTKIIVGPDGKIVKTIVGEDPAFYTLLDELFGKK